MIIATYNVEFLFDEGQHQHSGQAWTYTADFVAERVRNLAATLKEMQADVLLLQEVGSQSVVQKIIDASGLDYKSFFAEPDRFGVGNVVLYRVPAAQVRSIPTTGPLPVFSGDDADNLSPKIASRRGFVSITVDYNGRPLHIIGLHIKANFPVGMQGRGDEAMSTQLEAADGLIRSGMFRLSQAKKLRQVVDELLAADAQAQIIVAGDFNAAPNDSVRKVVQGVLPDAATALSSALRDVPAEQRYASVLPNGTKQQIDDMLCSASMQPRVRQARILHQDLTGHQNSAPHMGSVKSDHAAIVIELL